MEILHITPSTNGYELVTLLANAVNKRNSMAMIERKGEKFFTGGFLINDTPEIRGVLDSMPKDKQFEFIKSFKTDPFVKFYYEDIE
jgi:hypothetical protein